jgi:hypothetical protein
MAKTTHVLDQLDPARRTAVCAVHGPVRIRRRMRLGPWHCELELREAREAKRWRRNAGSERLARALNRSPGPEFHPSAPTGRNRRRKTNAASLSPRTRQNSNFMPDGRSRPGQTAVPHSGAPVLTSTEEARVQIPSPPPHNSPGHRPSESLRQAGVLLEPLPGSKRAATTNETANAGRSRSRWHIKRDRFTRPSDYEPDAPRRNGRKWSDLACSRWEPRRSGRIPTGAVRSSGRSLG